MQRCTRTSAGRHPQRRRRRRRGADPGPGLQILGVAAQGARAVAEAAALLFVVEPVRAIARQTVEHPPVISAAAATASVV